MKNVWLYIKHYAGRIMGKLCFYLVNKVLNIMRNVEMVYRILLFCWKWIVVRFLTKKYPHFKKSRIRRRWEDMHHYKAELEIIQDFQEDNPGFLNVQNIPIGNHGRVIIIKRNHAQVRSATLADRIVGMKTNHELMPGTAFSKN